MSRNPVLYKVLVIGFIVLFIGIGIQPAFANELYMNKETKENSDEIRTSDGKKEIISYITGNITNLTWINRKGFFRGEVNITGRDPCLFLHGLMLTENGVEYYWSFIYNVYVYYFIGVWTWWLDTPVLFGIALGNIEW
ncbi:MAG: hypothetical protein JSU91_00845 [Thermoplasmatales archaeon]|nr:MAG: hypothetical protein JSU91_00845 [Thermoplasmatales archaeon]